MISLNEKLAGDGVGPIAIAWSYAGAISNVLHQMPGITAAEAEQTLENLIRHINSARNYIAGRTLN